VYILSTIRRVAAVFVSATCVHIAAAQAQPTADTPIPGQGPAVVRMTASIVFATVVLQVSHSPDAWPRTAGGAARRLADQTGFVAIRSIADYQLRRAVPWTASVSPCPTRLAARTWCAVTQTLVAYNRDGAPRPDVARVGSVAVASFGSLLWRPERASRGDASVFMLSRVGSGLLVAVLRRGLGARGKAVPTDEGVDRSWGRPIMGSTDHRVRVLDRAIKDSDPMIGSRTLTPWSGSRTLTPWSHQGL